jgi:hypothetical protein
VIFKHAFRAISEGWKNPALFFFRCPGFFTVIAGCLLFDPADFLEVA